MEIKRIEDITVFEKSAHKSYTWPIFERYILKDDWVIAIWDLTKAYEEKTYQPYFEISLLSEFAKLKKTPNHKQLLKFVYRYGLPNVTPEKAYGNRPKGQMLDDNVNAVYLEAYRLRDGLELWELLGSVNTEQPSKTDEIILDNYIKEKYSKEYWEDFKRLRKLEKADNITLLYNYLAGELTNGVFHYSALGITPCFNVHEKRGKINVFQGWRTYNLAAVAWLQLAFIVCGERIIKRCRKCNNLFSATRSDQEYCPKPKDSKRGGCKNNANCNSYQKKKREASKGSI